MIVGLARSEIEDIEDEGVREEATPGQLDLRERVAVSFDDAEIDRHALLDRVEAHVFEADSHFEESSEHVEPTNVLDGRVDRPGEVVARRE